MLGLNHRVRKTPVRRSTTKLQSVTSPSMKDQWSGKTLRSCFLPALARPSRSSAQVAAAPTLEGGVACAAVLPLVRAVLRLAPSAVVDIYRLTRVPRNLVRLAR